jgi:transcriptional regulator with XRE-family HTH domain
MWQDIYTSVVSLLDQIAAIRHPGDTIRERRIDLGWTQTELAARSGVTQADISKLENGRLDARWSTIQRLSTVLAEADESVRSLANGARRERRALGAAKWRPKGPTLTVDRNAV